MATDKTYTVRHVVFVDIAYHGEHASDALMAAVADVDSNTSGDLIAKAKAVTFDRAEIISN